MKKVSRRNFLRDLATGGAVLAGGWLIRACGAAQPLPSPTVPPNTAVPATEAPTAAATAAATSAATASATAAPTAAPTLRLPDLAVARAGEPEDLVRRALAALGGIERFVPRGANVIIKPNICVAYHSFEYAATTNPWVVAALVKLCLEAGAGQVRVMDSPFGGTPEEAYRVSGIAEQVEAAGGTMEVMSGYKYVKTEIPQGKDIHQVMVYDDILKADVLINVPIPKTHSLARLTLGMKNLMGCIFVREDMHRNMGQRLADLSTLIRPTLTVVDAVRILTDHGPTGGNLGDVKQLDTVIAGTDIVACDAYATTLFGMKQDEMAYVRAGAEMGLGRFDLENLAIAEV